MLPLPQMATFFKLHRTVCQKPSLTGEEFLQLIDLKVFKNMAEGEGFEPSVAFATSVFKTGALNQTLPPLRVGETLDKGVEFGKQQSLGK